MRLLILGGTRFLGRAVAEIAQERHHELTLFHRGQSNPDLFPNAEHILGDRDDDLRLLDGRSFDACVDTSGYVPRIVRASATALANRVQHYAFVSSVSVYRNPLARGTDEDSELATALDNPDSEEVTGETYGPLKALCEAEVSKAFGSSALLVRPGLIIGPHDTTDRFTYWPWRIARGGAVLAPGRPGRFVQLIDVRDLASWILLMLEGGKSGAFNAVSPPGVLTMEDVLSTCVEVSGADAQLEWIPDGFLLKHNVGAWMEMPLWIPESDPIAAGFFSFVPDRAVKNGLRFRGLEETVRDTLKCVQTRKTDEAWKAGMARGRERELLSEWHAVQSSKN